MPKWIDRRVDALRLTSTARSRWFTSIDFSPPPGPCYSEDDGQVIIPVGYLPKRDLVNFDISLSGCSSVSVLTSEENWSHLITCLTAASSEILEIGNSKDGDGSNDELGEYQDALSSLVKGDRLSADANLKEVRGCINKVLEKRIFDSTTDEGKRDLKELHQNVNKLMALLNRLAPDFVLMVRVPAEDLRQRMVLKFSFTYDPGTRSHDEDHSAPSFSQILEKVDLYGYGTSKSYHFEVEVPPQIAVRCALLQTSQNKVVVPSGEPELTPSRFLHIHEPQDGSTYARIDLLLEPLTSSGAVAIARNLAIATVALCFAAVLLKCTSWVGDSFSIPSSSATVVVAAFAFSAGWMTSIGEHDVVRQVLVPVRRITTLQAVGLILMAGKLSVPLVSWASTVAWITIFAIEVGAAVWWSVARCMLKKRPKRFRVR